MEKCSYCGSEREKILNSMNSSSHNFKCGSSWVKEIKYKMWDSDEQMADCKEEFKLEDCKYYKQKQEREKRLKKLLEDGKK